MAGNHACQNLKGQCRTASCPASGCRHIVCFGDGINDIPMFRIADECYAVANAAPELKEIATDIIPCNNEDGVAKWLLAHCLNQR